VTRLPFLVCLLALPPVASADTVKAVKMIEAAK
jgi:hypothetical protein